MKWIAPKSTVKFPAGQVIEMDFPNMARFVSMLLKSGDYVMDEEDRKAPPRPTSSQ